MTATLFCETLDSSETDSPLGAEACLVTLSDGTRQDIGSLDRATLEQLQWDEERAFARLLLATPKGSAERTRRFAHAYDTVTTILGRIHPHTSGLEMGYNPKYVRLVFDLLGKRFRQTGEPPRVFEVGYGSGALLGALCDAGLKVAGIEVSAAMREQACRRLPEDCHDRLLLGNLLDTTSPDSSAQYELVFWNDVLEHLVPDDALDFVRRMHGLLVPGGCLVTITPNWHNRPSDVTAKFSPPRTVAAGLHLRECTLGETSALLRQAGFVRVGTPLVVTRRRMIVCGTGLAGGKRAFEPLLEWLPFRLTRLLCRGLGLNCTIAWRR